MTILRAFWLFATRVTWRQPPAWTYGDAQQWERWLRSEAGRKILRILAAEVANANHRAALSKGSAFEAGWACGFGALLAWVQQLAAAGEPEAADAGAEEDAELEHLRP